MFFLSCVCYSLVRVCSFVPCGHLLGKGWPLGSHLWCLLWVCHFPIWYPGSGVVLDCIDSWSLHPYLLLIHVNHLSAEYEQMIHMKALFSQKIHKIGLLLQLWLTFYGLVLSRQSWLLSSALSHLLMFLGSKYCKQYGPRSECSLRSTLIWIHSVCFHDKI